MGNRPQGEQQTSLAGDDLRWALSQQRYEASLN